MDENIARSDIKASFSGKVIIFFMNPAKPSEFADVEL
jgi:hypothetical protein